MACECPYCHAKRAACDELALARAAIRDGLHRCAEPTSFRAVCLFELPCPIHPLAPGNVAAIASRDRRRAVELGLALGTAAKEVG